MLAIMAMLAFLVFAVMGLTCYLGCWMKKVERRIKTVDVQKKEVVVGVVTDMDLLHYVTQNEGTKLQSISENSGASTNSGHSTPEPIE